MSGFEKIAFEIAIEKGMPEDSIFYSKSLELPGYFRPEKRWDLLIIDKDTLVAVIEFKSQVGPSFGNNFNNRTEEAIGSATDLWIAYREGAFGDQIRPWLGYLFLLEEHTKSTSIVRLRQPHFKVFKEFEDTSYADRYTILIKKLIRERHYDAGCLLLSPQKEKKSIHESIEFLSAKRFFCQFESHIDMYLRTIND